MRAGRHGTRMQRNYTGDTPGLAGRVSGASPRWLRLTRAGDVITGYNSAGGTSWTKIGTITLPGLPPTVEAGLFVTSPSQSVAPNSGVTSASGTGGAATAATATFDRASLHAAWPALSRPAPPPPPPPHSPHLPAPAPPLPPSAR